MRNFWNQVPGLRIVFAVIAGIGIEIYSDSVLHLSREIFWLMVVLFFSAFIGIVLISLVKNVTTLYRFRVVIGTMLSLCMLSFGYIHTWLHSEKNLKKHFQKVLADESFIVGRVVKPPLEKEKILTAVIEIVRVINGSTQHAVKGNMLVNVLRDSTSNHLRYGDVIVFNAKVEEFDDPKNPEEFSFKLYQSFHNIYQRTFLRTGDWKIVARNQGNPVMSIVHNTRAYFLSLLIKHVKDRNDFGVATSIMLGYHDYRNGDITRAYASSGALHVLSVSGLHVGIIFFMLNSILGWMDKKGRKTLIAKSIIVIVLIWFYAGITGLCPSVLRSATMFTGIQFGKMVNRNVNTYNVITLSALVLFLFDPFIVTEVGFRLSYLAVIGIIYLQPKIYSLLAFRNWLADKAWMIIAVSLAAQIATFPLGLYYFHQFPVLFLISNLVVIPAGYVILSLGIALFFMGQIAYLSDVVGWGFEFVLLMLNKFIFFIDSLSFALIQGISITMVEMILIYLLILLFCWLTEEGRPKVLIVSLLVVFGLASFNSYEAIQQSKQKKIVVYAVPKARAVAFISGRTVRYDFDDKILNHESSMLFHVRHHWWSCDIRKETEVGNIRLDFGKLILFEGKKILLIDSAMKKPDFELENKLHADLVILSHNPKVYLDNLRKLAHFDQVVFDSSNKEWRIEKWKKECEAMNIPYWDVNRQGAYLQEVNDKKIKTL